MRVLVCVIFLFACGEVVKSSPDAALTVDADPCASGPCECTAATESADCGAHEFCNESSSGRTCECVAGYTEGVGGCAWTGVISDPAFAETTAWTPVRGALLNPTAGGGLNPGEVNFLPGALCDLAYVEQTFEMPPFSKSEPLVLELSYKNQPNFQEGAFVMTGVSFGPGWIALPYTNAAFQTTRICLGSASYAPEGTQGRGGPVTLKLGAYAKPTDCPGSMLTGFSFDHARILVANAGECGAEPGFGPNFDAEGEGGWTFQQSGQSTAGFSVGVGAGGTRAARLNKRQRCDVVTMSTTVSVTEVANPALELHISTSENAVATATFGSTLRADLPANFTGTRRICLPASLRGHTDTVSFNVNGGNGACADIINMSLAVDNLRVVDEPSCSSAGGVVNPSFEHASLFNRSLSTNGNNLTTAAVVNGPQAHSGASFLYLETTARCTSASVATEVIVPPPSGDAGPALTVWSDITNNPEASTSVRIDGVAVVPLPEGGGYQKTTVCLDPAYVGRPRNVTLHHTGGSGVCQATAAQGARIDDLEATTDASCPTE